MKKILCLLLATLLLLTGCQSPAVETTVPPETTGVQISESIPAETAPDKVVDPAGELAFANPGKVRITYTPTGTQNFVRYVTSVEDLPDVEALAGYDAAFFENHALLIVVETVNSGSVQMEIESIKVSGDTATVDIKRTMDGDYGTTDMATWMLWAEMEKGLEYTWCIKDRDASPEGEKY